MLAELVDHDWVMRRLGLKSRDTLHCWVHRRQIPHVRVSPRVVRFDREEVERWIDSRRVRPL